MSPETRGKLVSARETLQTSREKFQRESKLDELFRIQLGLNWNLAVALAVEELSEEEINKIRNDLKLITQEIEHRNGIQGVINNCDKKNAGILDATAEKGAKAQLCQDVNGKFILSGHGNMSKRTNDAAGSVEKYHVIDTDDGTQETTIYIQKLIDQGKIPANSKVLILSCYISEIDTDYIFSNNVTIKPGTTIAGGMFHIKFKPQPYIDAATGNYLVATVGQGHALN